MSKSSTVSTNRLTTVKQDVEKVLDKFYAEKIKAADGLSSDYARQWQVMERVHAGGGKRLRPYMMMLAYQGLGGANYKSVLPVAAAIELLHTSLLIHDDIIDRDFVRHGRPNVAGQYQQIYQKSTDRDHLSLSAALLAGDILISSSYQLVNESSLSPEDKIKANRILGDAIFEVCGGELLDTEAVMLEPDQVNALGIASMKTAGYSFEAPLLMGAVLAGAGQDALDALRHYARALGVAFQLADDLLGVFGPESKTGKPEGSDLIEGKRTYIIQRAFNNLDEPKRRQLVSLLGRELSADELKRVRELLVESGAIDETTAVIDNHASAALKAINTLKIDESIRTDLIELVDRATKRSF